MQAFPKTFKIKKIRRESPHITSFFFKIKEIAERANPGQFVMVWVPLVDEKPMSLSYIGKDCIGITVQSVGMMTMELNKKKVGDYVGIRGPYGRGFDYTGVYKALIIGGGVGVAPLMPLAERIAERGEVTAVIGAKTAEEIIFLERLEELCEDVIITTEDGTLGKKGLVTDILEDLLRGERFEKVFMCGPEKMMEKGLRILEKFNVEGEISMERWMKCGVGICGHCVLDELGIRVCKEGPVFDFATVKKIKEFGKYRRGSSGRRVAMVI
ncbi:MAG: dihydroorotate dehydrogenase electron transfer subunit [Candidatus Methanospirareceae archaeon]